MVLTIFAQQNGPLGMLLPFILLAALIYFFGIRPVSAQKKKQDQLHGSLKVGDDVITIGAWKGTILEIQEDGYLLRLSEDTTAFILKAGIARKVIKESDLIDEDYKEDDEDEVLSASTEAGAAEADPIATDADPVATDAEPKRD